MSETTAEFDVYTICRVWTVNPGLSADLFENIIPPAENWLSFLRRQQRTLTARKAKEEASQISKQAILPTSHNSAPMVGSSPILAVLSRKWADCVCIMTTLPHNPYW